MKKKIAALILAVSLLLSGCGLVDFGQAVVGLLRGERPRSQTCFADMEYARPDMERLAGVLDESCKTARSSEDLDTVLEAVYNYYDEYDWFYTNSNLANIHYSADLRDSYWAAENAYCSGNSAEVEAGLQTLYEALADSPCREELESEEYFGPDYFDQYDEETIWDEGFVALLEEEAEMVNRYYELNAQAADVELYTPEFYDAYGYAMEELFLELIALRREIAAYTGYDSYPQFAYDFYYYRDYNPLQAAAYLEKVGRELSPLYRAVIQNWNYYAGESGRHSNQEETLRYVRTAAQAMGGVVEDAFETMEAGGLYDLRVDENKYASSFEVFLTGYGVPYIFTCPSEQVYDWVTFSHEFGHFANDYATYGSTGGIDVAEVFSQGMTYLSLCYGENGEALREVALADCLCTYVEQAAYAAFEQQVYGLSGEELTVENVRKLYEEVSAGFGVADSLYFDSRDYIFVNHFYTNPQYVISYVVSNDAALQLYQLEREEPGAGLAIYQEALTSQQPYFLAFLREAGLTTPFAARRLSAVRETLQTELRIG